MDDASPLPAFEASVHVDGDVSVVRVCGEVDIAAVPELRARLGQTIDSTGHDVEVDLAAVTFIDSTGLAVLVDAYGRLQSTQRTLRIARPAPPVRRLFELAGLNTLFDEPQLDADAQTR